MNNQTDNNNNYKSYFDPSEQNNDIDTSPQVNLELTPTFDNLDYGRKVNLENDMSPQQNVDSLPGSVGEFSQDIYEEHQNQPVYQPPAEEQNFQNQPPAAPNYQNQQPPAGQNYQNQQINYQNQGQPYNPNAAPYNNYPQQNDTKVLAIISLVLAILSLVLIFVVTPIVTLPMAIVAVVLSGSSKKKEGPSGLATAGLVIGIIGIVANVLIGAFIIIGLIVAISDPYLYNEIFELY